MRVVLAADHRGYNLKEALKAHLKTQGYDVEDVGAHASDPADDYPDFALAGARKIAADPEARGIFFCGSGMGMDIVANKVKGVRATVVYSKESAVHARERDDANVMTIAADVFSAEDTRDIVSLFLSTPFGGAERDIRRQKKIWQIEEEHFK